jgi:hypothetical protein
MPAETLKLGRIFNRCVPMRNVPGPKLGLGMYVDCVVQKNGLN